MKSLFTLVKHEKRKNNWKKKKKNPEILKIIKKFG